MDFHWSPEQQAAQVALLRAVREAFTTTPVPEAKAEGEPFFTPKQWRTLGELGVLGLCIPVQHGGQGRGALETAGLIEAFGRGCPDTGLVFAASAHLFACAVPIAQFASDRVRDRLLPGLCAGDLVAGNAMTEEGAGSDVSRLSVTAEAAHGGWILNGQKSFVSNGPAADVLVTYATTDPAAGYLGVTGFVVERDTAGVSVGAPFEKMGLLSCPAGTVTFQDCWVPADQVLGAEGSGAAVFQHSMGWERACLFAGYLGLMERLLQRCIEHARSRAQFGRPIGTFQAVSNRIVDMRLRLDSARLLLHRACWEMDQGQDATLSVALSKLAVSESAVSAALDAVQIFGARGYRSQDGIEAFLRDTVPSTIFSGTSDIQRLIAAKELGL